MVAVRNVVFAILIPAATSSTMVIRDGTLVDQAIRLLFPGILVLVLLSVMIDYFNSCMCARISMLVWENLRWYFQVCGLVLFGCLLKNTRLYHGRRKTEDLRRFLVSFRFYFVIARDNLYISTVYYLLL
jgi:hypothetical protein